jgi:hypothetical protein
MNTLTLPDNIANDPTRSKLLGLLGAGVSQTAAALACGITDGYVSQILQDPEFVAALANQRTEKLEVAIKHDSTVESVEAKALAILEAKLPFVRNPLEAARIFQILNSAKKRAAIGEGASTEQLGAQQVSIVLPKAAAVHISMNSSNQVIDVAGRSMATLPSRALPTLSKDVQEAKVRETLAAKDTDRASSILENVNTVHKTIIGGVVRVL